MKKIIQSIFLAVALLTSSAPTGIGIDHAYASERSNFPVIYEK